MVQSMFVAETWITDIAKRCSLPAHVVRQRNFLVDGDLTVFNQKIANCNVGVMMWCAL